MIPLPSGVRVWIAAGHTDMRRGMQGLARQVQEVLQRDPHVGDLYVFRGRSGSLVKILWHDGVGMSLAVLQPATIVEEKLYRGSLLAIPPHRRPLL